MDLKDKVVIITGTSGGIGAAIAQELDAAGAKLVLTARSKDKLDAVAKNFAHAVVVPGEITDPQLPQQLLDTAADKFGGVDIIINNAGMMTVGALDEVDVEKLCQMVRVNYESVVRMSYLGLRALKKRGYGYLLNISSIAGYKDYAQIGAYSGTKFAVEALTDALRMELAGTGVGVSALAPGTVDTGLYDGWSEEQKKMVGEGLKAEDIARVARFILETPDHMRLARVLAVPSNSLG